MSACVYSSLVISASILFCIYYHYLLELFIIHTSNLAQLGNIGPSFLYFPTPNHNTFVF